MLYCNQVAQLIPMRLRNSNLQVIKTLVTFKTRSELTFCKAEDENYMYYFINWCGSLRMC